MLNLEYSTNLELAEYQFQLLYSQVNLVSQLLYPKLYDWGSTWWELREQLVYGNCLTKCMNQEGSPCLLRTFKLVSSWKWPYPRYRTNLGPVDQDFLWPRTFSRTKFMYFCNTVPKEVSIVHRWIIQVFSQNTRAEGVNFTMYYCVCWIYFNKINSGTTSEKDVRAGKISI